MSFVFQSTYLISFGFDDSEHLKSFSLFKGVVRDTFRTFPSSVPEAVHGHILVHLRVEVESNVISVRLPRLEIDSKPALNLKR